MIKYAVIRKNAECLEKIEKNVYGICAYTVDNELIDIINCAYNISNNFVRVRALADKLNQNGVDPIHLYDIIEDELYYIEA